jgi:hypothetical protein
LFLLSFGGPYLFGLGAVAAGRSRRGPFPRLLLQASLALFQAQLVLWAARAWLEGFGVAPGALFGFSLISGGYLVYYSARSAAETDRGVRPSVRWLANWGAMLTLALGAWLRLQMATGLRLGPAVEVAMAASVVLIIATRRR